MKNVRVDKLDLDVWISVVMMASSNGNIFRVTGHLCGEFTGDRWIPLTKASDAELWCFLDLRLNKRLSKQWWGWWFETPLRSSWCHCNVNQNSRSLLMLLYFPGVPRKFVLARTVDHPVAPRSRDVTAPPFGIQCRSPAKRSMRGCLVQVNWSHYQNLGAVKSLILVAPNPKTEMILVSSCRCLCSIHWNQVLKSRMKM